MPLKSVTILNVGSTGGDTMRALVTSMTITILAALASVAQAENIEIGYRPGAGSPVMCTAALPGPVTCPNVAGPPFTITELQANSNSPGTTGLSELTSDTLDLKNVSGSTQTLQIAISANDFTEPTGTPIEFLSSIGGTVVTGGPGSGLTFGSCLDPGNSLNTQFVFQCNSKPGVILSGVSTPFIGNPGAFADSKTSTLLSLTKPFSINQNLLVTLPPGGEINFSASTKLTVIPEPSSMLLLGSGVLGLAQVLRRKR